MRTRIWNILLVLTIIFPYFPVSEAQSVQAASIAPGHSAAQAAATVTITAAGFDPAQVTIQPGDTVVWINQTAQGQQIVGGQPYTLYLPLVLRNQSGAQRLTVAPTASQAVHWGSDEIGVGERFTHTFALAGDYPYYLASNPRLTGLVIVQGTPQPDFAIGIAPTSRNASPIIPAQYQVTVTATHGFSTPVTLAVTDLPAGVTAHWSANPVTPTASALLTLTLTEATPAGPHALTLVGQAGALSHTVGFEVVRVGDVCAMLTDVSFTSDSPRELGQPMHFTATITPTYATTPLTYTWDFGDASPLVGGTEGGISHTFATTGTHAVTLTVANPCSQDTTTAQVMVVDVGACIGVSDATFTSDSPVELGQPMHFTATATPANATLPLTYTWDFGDASPPLGGIEGGTISHTFTTTGTHIVTLTVANPCGQDTYTAEVVVTTPPPHPDFALGVQPATQTITRGQSAAYTVTVMALHGFTEAVTLTLTGAPAGASSAWETNPLTPTAQTTLWITTTQGGPTGTFALVITGATGALTHTAATELVVVSEDTPTTPDFLLDITPESRALQQGQSASYEVALTALFGFNAPVTFQLGGAPGATTATWTQNPLTPHSTVTTTLTVTTTDATPVGDSTLVITGTGGGKTHALQAGLDVTLRPLPNLIVEALTTEPGVPVAGQPFTVQVRLANRDTGHATGAFAVDWYTAPPTATQMGDLTWTQHGLAAGYALTLTGQYTFTGAGTYPLYAQVDRTNIITERNELDNLTGPITLTVSATPQPDLLITALSVTPLTPTLGRPATLTVQVKNQGTLSTTAPVRVDGYITSTPPVGGQVANLSTSLPPLEPGQSALATLPYTFTQAGAQTVYAQVDTLDAVAESLEANNGGGPLTFTVRTPQPDLVVESITFNPTVGWINEPVTATVRVRNQGDADAPAFRTDWYLDPAAPPVAGQTGDGTWDVPGLAVGATVDVTLTHSFATTGTHWVYGQVDPLAVITESMETNNLSGASVAIINEVINVCGAIVTHTTWYAGRLYQMTCDVTVNAGVTLTVEPNTVVQANSSVGLIVNGTLRAIGTPAAPILFTANTAVPAPGFWDGIRFNPSSVNSTLAYAIVEYAGNTSTDYDSGIYVQSNNVFIFESVVRFNHGHGIYGRGIVSPEIVNTAFENNGGYAAYLQVANHALNPTFVGNTAVGNDINGLGVAGCISGTATLPASPSGFPYVVAGLGVDLESQLTLLAGTQIKHVGGLGIEGTLIAGGTPVAPVYGKIALTEKVVRFTEQGAILV